MKIIFWLTVILLSNTISVISSSSFSCTNDLLDDSFKRQLTFDSSQDLMKEIIKGTLDFASFSLTTATQEPISAFSIQLCLVNTLEHIKNGLDVNVDYESFLSNTETALSNDPLIREIFRPNSIKRWFEILSLGRNLNELKRTIEIIKKRLEWILTQISKLDFDELGDFLYEFFLYPPQPDQIATELQDFIDRGAIDDIDAIGIDELVDRSLPSAFEVLQAIQQQDMKRISALLHDDDGAISVSPDQLKIALKISDYQIRKAWDHKISINFRVDSPIEKFKKPFLLTLKDVLRIIEEFSRAKHFNIELLLDKVLSNPSVLGENCDIFLISNFIQDLLNGDSLLRQQYLSNTVDYDMEGMKDNIKELLADLISFLRSLKDEREMDNFLRPIHAFFFTESMEYIQDVIDALAGLFAARSNVYYSFDEERRFKKEQVVYCMELGLYLSASKDSKLKMKDFIMTELLGIKNETDITDGASLLRSQTFNTIDQMSTIGTFSVDYSQEEGEGVEEGSDGLLEFWELEHALFADEIINSVNDDNSEEIINSIDDDNSDESFISSISSDDVHI